MKCKHFSMMVVVALGLCAAQGCKKSESPAPQAAPKDQQTSTAPQAASASRNSFRETASRLDSGGDFYMYMSTEQVLQGLSGKIGSLRQIVSGLPDIGKSGREQAGKVFDIVTHLVQSSGVEQISGVGMSSIEIEKGLYRNKFFIHHYAGQGNGFLWALGGRKARPLAELDLLPSTTALAYSSDFDAPMLWSVVREEVQRSGFQEASAALENMPGMFEGATGLKWEKALDSLGGGFSIVVTLDESRKMSLPVPEMQMEVPEPGVLLIIRTKDDVIFDRLAQEVQKIAGPEVVSVDTPELKMRTLPTPFMAQLRPSVATAGGYLFVATSDALIQEVLAVKAGKKTGLKATDEFKRLAREVPTEGNGFYFMSQRFGQTITDVQTQALNKADAGAAKALMPLIELQQPGFGYTVSANTDEGWLSVGNANVGQARAVLTAVTVAPTAILAAMVLPALAKAKEKAQVISCMNNTRQICLAMMVYANDHENKLPPASTWCDAIKESLGSEKVLKCPQAGQGQRSHYAFNERLGGISLSKIESPERMVLVFEAEGGWNLAGGPELLPDTPRHGKVINVGFLDGHVEAVSMDRIGKLHWVP